MWLRHKTAVSAPDWAPAGTVATQSMSGGVLCSTHDTYGANPLDTGWFDCGDGWQAQLLENEQIPGRELVDGASRVRICDGTPVDVVVAHDMRGREWLAPVVLRPDGGVAMPLPIVRGDDGLPERVPTEAQARLIKAARFLRDAVEQAGDGGVEVETECVSELLAGTLHMTREGIERSAILDDMLCVEVILAACGVAAGDSEDEDD